MIQPCLWALCYLEITLIFESYILLPLKVLFSVSCDAA